MKLKISKHYVKTVIEKREEIDMKQNVVQKSEGEKIGTVKFPITEPDNLTQEERIKLIIKLEDEGEALKGQIAAIRAARLQNTDSKEI
jgi:hypothetical protein